MNIIVGTAGVVSFLPELDITHVIHLQMPEYNVYFRTSSTFKSAEVVVVFVRVEEEHVFQRVIQVTERRPIGNKLNPVIIHYPARV